MRLLRLKRLSGRAHRTPSFTVHGNGTSAVVLGSDGGCGAYEARLQLSTGVEKQEDSACGRCEVDGTCSDPFTAFRRNWVAPSHTLAGAGNQRAGLRGGRVGAIA